MKHDYTFRRPKGVYRAPRLSESDAAREFGVANTTLRTRLRESGLSYELLSGRKLYVASEIRNWWYARYGAARPTNECPECAGTGNVPDASDGRFKSRCSRCDGLGGY